MAALHEHFAQELPTYNETAKAWPSLKYGEGRVIILYPRLPMAGLAPTPSGVMGDIGFVHFDVDITRKGIVMDQTFEFIHLREGHHSIVAHNPGMFGKDEKLEFEVKMGQTTYIKVVAEQFRKGPPIILSEKEALEFLAGLHHAIRKAIPFDELGQYGAGVSS